MREVIGNSLLYMWPRVFDRFHPTPPTPPHTPPHITSRTNITRIPRWLEKPDGSKVDCKWVDMGGAEKFYKYGKNFISYFPFFNIFMRPTDLKPILFPRDFLPAYLARNESCNRQVAATDDEV